MDTREDVKILVDESADHGTIEPEEQAEPVHSAEPRPDQQREDLIIVLNVMAEPDQQLSGTEIRAALENGQQVKLSGFGNFDLREKKERPGRNPKTGEEIPITARRVVTFRPGQKLKARVESYAGSE